MQDNDKLGREETNQEQFTQNSDSHNQVEGGGEIIADISEGQLTLGGVSELLNMPSTYAGWVRYEDGVNLVSYWKKDDTHVYGSYKRLSINQQGARSFDRNPEVSISRTTLDQFGHTVSSYNSLISSTSPRHAMGHLRREMNKHPGNGDFNTPPELPQQIGIWSLTEDSWSQTIWETQNGEAEVVADQTHIDSKQSQGAASRYTIRYQEENLHPSGVDIVTDVGRTHAFEIAINTMQQLKVPAGECHAKRKALRQVKGVGSAKAESLLFLGIGTPTELADYITNDNGLNYSHRAAIDKLLTTTIEDSIIGGKVKANE
jgi:hypothetical protein